MCKNINQELEEIYEENKVENKEMTINPRKCAHLIQTALNTEERNKKCL